MSHTEVAPVQGRFIVFEGLDGSGKTTMAGLFAEHLQANGEQVTRTREPGGTPFAEECRHLLFKDPTLSPQTQALLVNAARRDHVEKVIAPHMKQGNTVICDRWTLSTMVYQSGMKPKQDLELLCDIGSAGLMPDVMFILACDVATFRKRKAELNVERNHLDRMSDELYQQQLQLYVQYHAGGRRPTIWINTQGTKEEVLAEIIREYRAFTSRTQVVRPIAL